MELSPGPLRVLAPTVWLPEREPVPDADPVSGESDGYRTVAVARTQSGPEMAGLAAAKAVADAGVDPADVGLLLHAHSYYQGHDFFSVAHAVAADVGATGALPVAVQQMCNGTSAAFELADAWLATHPDGGPALVTSGDAFTEPGFDRAESDYGMVYGDAGTAALLTRGRTGDGLLVRSLRHRVAAELEAAHRDSRTPSAAPRWRSPQVDVRATKRAFFAGYGLDRFRLIERRMVGEVVADALAHSGLRPGQLKAVVLPRLAASALDATYRPVLAELTDAEMIEYGATTGHLGAGDLTAGLADLGAERRLADGDAAIVLNAGAGFTWSCLVVEQPS